MPKRAQRVRKAGQPGIPAGAKYVGRPSKYGNPFKVGDVADRIAMTNRRGNTCIVVVTIDTPEQAVEFYRRWLNGSQFLPTLEVQRPTLAQIRADLAWIDLACWCPLTSPCHADVLLELANA